MPVVRGFPVYRIAIILLATLVAAFVLSKTFGLIVSDRNPSLALRMDPGNARALARASTRLLENGLGPKQRDSVARADAMARRALARDLTLSPAARTIGIAAATKGDGVLAGRAMTFALAASRRDLPTLLWCIEENVRKDNVGEALRCYDIALRTHVGSYDLLMPVLVAAIEDPALIAPIARVLVRRPPWSEQYLKRLIATGRVPANAFQVFRALRVAGSPPSNLATADLAARLFQDRKYDLAWQSYLWLQPAAQRGVLRDGDFEAPDSTEVPYVFDWSYAEELDRRAEKLSPGASGTQTGLVLNSSFPGTAILASQNLLLPKGSYELRAVSFAAEAGARASAALVLVCAADQAELGRLSLPLSVPERAVTTRVIVRDGCPAQQLRVLVTNSDAGATTLAVDQIALRPIGAGVR